MNLRLKQKIIGIIAIIGTILILIFQHGLASDKPVAILEKPTPTVIQTNTPELISTNPSPLDKSILWAIQPIIFAFNLPLENIPEFKYKIDPKIDYKIELSNDKKIITLTPAKPLPLGQTFTFSISTDTKFEGKKTLDKDYTFHFQTIVYKGV